MTKARAGMILSRQKIIINIEHIFIFSEYSRKVLDLFFLTGDNPEDLTRVLSMSKWETLKFDQTKLKQNIWILVFRSLTEIIISVHAEHLGFVFLFIYIFINIKYIMHLQFNTSFKPVLIIKGFPIFCSGL